MSVSLIRPLLAATSTLLVACASPAGGGGGAALVGGSVGNACDPQIHKQGCAPGTATRVSCDAASKTWIALDTCPAGQACTEALDPSGAGMRLATCVVVQASPTDAGSTADGVAVDTGTASPADGGASDTNVVDASGPDTGVVDAGTPDTGALDSGTPDTGIPDSGTPDTGILDSGILDSGILDSGTPDTGVTDTGAPDAGSSALGCKTASDQAFIKLIYASAAVTDAVSSAVTDCTLKVGCLAKSGDQAQQACILSCLMANSAVKSQNVSASCVACFATHKGWCGATTCLTKCAADTASATCKACLATNCDPAFEACVGAAAGPICGDGKCEAGETASSCAADCASSGAKGCTSSKDVAFNNMLASSSSATSQFSSAVLACTLQVGCLAKPGDHAQQACIRDCILDNSVVKSSGVSASCAACYGTWKGWCGAKNCITQCAANPASAGCQQCLATHCDGQFDLCVAGKL